MATPKEMTDQIVAIVKGLSPLQKLLGGLVVAAVLGGLLFIALRDTGGNDYKVLFSGLTQQDAADVVSRLKEQNIPYQLSENGTAILVPSGQVYETRLSLAGEGLPRGGGVGFEIFDKTSLGTTDFVQRLNYQRAMQGELARTIRQFEQVEEARVHIATPKESVFIEDEKPTTASVSVRLRPGHKLNQGQIQSIVHLVASAIPGLDPDNLTVVDTAGRLLYRKKGDETAMLSATQLEYQLKVEETLRNKVESMLEEVVGVNRAQARVTAEMDFNRATITEESYDPEGQVVRSEQVLKEEDLRGSKQPEGIPGVKGNLATFAESGEGKSGGNGYSRNNVTRNYEISRVTKQVQEAVGSMRRLSVAVMVDGTYDKVVDKDGRTSLKYKPRTTEEMQWFERLVKNAIGYSEDRGDQVEVVSMPFAISSIVEPQPEPMDKWRALIERLAMPLIYLLIAVAFLLFVVRPFFRLMTVKQIEAQKAAEMAEKAQMMKPEEEEELSLSPRGLSDQERIYRLAQSDPARAADLVKRWLREGV